MILKNRDLFELEHVYLKENSFTTPIPFGVAKQMFSSLSNTKIPFDYKQEGCFARAYEMALFLNNECIQPLKIYVKHRMPKTKFTEYNWKYHAAILVLAERDTELKPFVIDPSLFTEIVSISTWLDRLRGDMGADEFQISIANQFYSTLDSLSETQSKYLFSDYLFNKSHLNYYFELSKK